MVLVVLLSFLDAAVLSNCLLVSRVDRGVGTAAFTRVSAVSTASKCAGVRATISRDCLSDSPTESGRSSPPVGGAAGVCAVSAASVLSSSFLSASSCLSQLWSQQQCPEVCGGSVSHRGCQTVVCSDVAMRVCSAQASLAGQCTLSLSRLLASRRVLNACFERVIVSCNVT